MTVEYNTNTYNLPDFLIVGAAKSGTTSLYYNLSKSDEIHFSEVKEPHFFSFYGNKPNFKSPEKLSTVVHSIDSYSDFYKHVGKGQLLGDASPSYLYKHEETIKNLLEIYGDKAKDIKIIIVLRNPIERAWSQYWHFRKNFNEESEFLDAIKTQTIDQRMLDNWNVFYNYIDFGMYSTQIEAYKKVFKNVKIFLFEDLKNNPQNLMSELCSFLNIEEINIDENRKYNPSGLPKKNIYGNLWKTNSKLKSLKRIKNILPLKYRKKISNHVLERALEKQQLDGNSRTILSEIYSNEINKLYDMLKREEIKEWK